MGIRRRPEQAEQTQPTSWSERMIAAALARQTFQRKAVVLVPNCNWTGYECDLLCVEPGLRIIDVEIKISRADLKADAKKDKWWQQFGSSYAGIDPDTGRSKFVRPDPVARPWPVKVWKHYFALPEDIWDDSLLGCLPSPNCGVIALREGRYGSDNYMATVVRRAVPNPDAYRLTPGQVLDVARLANLRYWDAASRADNVTSRLSKLEQRARELGVDLHKSM